MADVGEAIKVLMEEKGLKVPSRPNTGNQRPCMLSFNILIVTGASQQSQEDHKI